MQTEATIWRWEQVMDDVEKDNVEEKDELESLSLGLITPRRAAELLQVSIWTIYDWVDKGRLDGIRLPSGRLRIKTDSVKSALSGDSTCTQ